MEQFLALKASAGSGKTFALSLRFVYLLFCGANPHQILTLTFTKKASDEMYHRIHQHLKILKDSLKNGDYAQTIIYQELIKEGLTHQDIEDHMSNIYEEFAQSKPRIMTIDAFFHSVLKKFCWYAGVSYRFEVGNAPINEINDEFLSQLNQQSSQQIARFCFSHNISLNQFLTMLMNLDKAYEEIDKSQQNVFLASSHDIAQEIIQKMQVMASWIRSVPNATPRVVKHFQKTSLAEIMKSPRFLLEWQEHTWLKKIDLSPMDNVRQEILNLLKDYFISKESEVLQWLQSYVQIYKNTRDFYLRKANLLTFDDVTLKSYELLYHQIDRDFFYFRLDDKITHILLDEFQDTSVMQYQILKPLMDEICAGNGRLSERSLFVVGDEKQSIYMFRGSFASVFEEASKRLQKSHLIYNYRSSPLVIAFNNTTFAPCYEGFVPSKYPKESASSEGYVKVQNCGEYPLEAAVYEELNTLLESGVSEDDIAILVFKNDDIQLLKEFINTKNPSIQLATEMSSSLFSKQEVKILLNALLFIQNRDSAFYLKNLLKLLGKAYNDDFSPQSALYTLKATRKPSELLLTLIEEFNIANNVSLKFLELSCDFLSIDEFLESLPVMMCSAPAQSNRGVKIMTIHKSKGLEFSYVILVDRFSGSQSDRQKFLYKYQEVSLHQIYYKMQGREDFDEEYKNVFEEEKKRKQQEELNVLYVAFTRAKEGLIVLQKNEKSAYERLSLKPTLQGVITPISKDSMIELESHSMPQVVEMSYHGKQSEFIRNEQETTSILNAAQWNNIKFGEALHSVFEMKLAYNMSDDDVHTRLLNRYGFYCNSSALSDALSKANACLQSEEFKQISRDKEILCEVSFIHQDKLYRMDTLLYNDKERIVLDYKSSLQGHENHQTQVQGYMQFLSSLDKGNPKADVKCRGYVVYPLYQRSFYEIFMF
nr:RecB-like helicase [Helicobacter sp. MIT 05-5293]